MSFPADFLTPNQAPAAARLLCQGIARSRKTDLSQAEQLLPEGRRACNHMEFMGIVQAIWLRGFTWDLYGIYIYIYTYTWDI